MRIVALIPGGISDQILSFPTLDDLKRYYPDTQIDVVVEPRAAGAYRVCKSVTNVMRFDFQDRNSLTDWVNLIGNIRDREYDVAIFMGQNWFVGLLLWMTGISTRIGYQGAGSIFLTNPVPLKTEQYSAATYHDLLQGLGINSPSPELALNVPLPDIDWAQKEQQRLGIKETGYILIHPGSGEALDSKSDQIYPAKNWQQIIQDFQQRQPDLPVVIIQSPADEQLVRSLLESNSQLKITSPPDLGKLAAMIAGANLLLCTDSAPMHLAVAVQTYTIALFGSKEPKKLLPLGDRAIAIKSPTTKMADISPQDVLGRVWNS